MSNLFRSVAVLVVVSLLAPSTVALARPAGVDQFRGVKLMINTGDKSEATDAVVALEDDAFVVRAKGGAVLKTIPYAAIKSAEYSYSKSPRWKSAIGVSLICIVCGVATAFMKGKKHWLTVTGAGEYALLQVDKDTYKTLLPAFESRSGVKVETVADDK